MTNEELNLKLYNKILDEQQAYRDYLMGQPAEEILRNAYELAIREVILLSFEYNDFTASFTYFFTKCFELFNC